MGEDSLVVGEQAIGGELLGGGGAGLGDVVVDGYREARGDARGGAVRIWTYSSVCRPGVS